MPSLKDIRLRIKSVQTTMQTTKAMKMVAASKLRRAQEYIFNMRPYAAKQQAILQHLIPTLDRDIQSPYAIERPVESILAIVITSNRGLCGAFNANINKLVVGHLNQEFPRLVQERKITVLAIGKKGYEYFDKLPQYSVFESQNFDVFAKLSFDTIVPIADTVLDGFVNKKWDRVLLYYNKFKNVMTQIRTVEPLLPITLPEIDEHQASSLKSDYIFEPDQATIVTQIIPTILKIQLYQAILESNVSEHGARMVSMDTATENANELLKDLRLTFNKARQAAITKEILEIVGGAEALSGGE